MHRGAAGDEGTERMGRPPLEVGQVGISCGDIVTAGVSSPTAVHAVCHRRSI